VDSPSEQKKLRQGSSRNIPTSNSSLKNKAEDGEGSESPSRNGQFGMKKGSTSNSAIKLAAVTEKREKSRDKKDKDDKKAKGKSPDRDKDRGGRPDKEDKDKKEKEKEPREKSVSNLRITLLRRKKVNKEKQSLSPSLRVSARSTHLLNFFGLTFKPSPDI